MNSAVKLKQLQRVLGHIPDFQQVEALFFCPKHPHHKKKLSVNLDTDQFHCWVCDWGGKNLLPLLRLKGETDFYREYRNIVFAGKNNTIVNKNFIAPELPKEYRSLSESWDSPYYHHALNYLQSRNVSAADIFLYKLGYAEAGKFSFRIIFPSFDAEGELNFVLGRSFYQKSGLPYYHDQCDKDIVFNEYLVDWYEPVIVVEGIFDALVAGINAIPCLGSNLGEDTLLFNQLLKAKEIYLSLDTDAYKKQMKLAYLLLEYGKQPYIIDLAGAKDPGSLTKEQFKQLKDKAIKMRSNLDLLKYKVRT